MQWDPKEVVDSRVVAFSEWWINLKDTENLETRAGVYLFANAKCDVKYICKAGRGGILKEVRCAITKKKNKGASQVRVMYTNSNAKAQSLEKYLITKYNPVNNRT